MHNKYLYLFILSFTLKFNIYSQKNDNSTRNDINKFLYEKKEISDKDLAFLLKNNKNDLKQQLENMITTKDSLVFNFAVDESETKDILSGKIPGHQYQYGRRYATSA